VTYIIAFGPASDNLSSCQLFALSGCFGAKLHRPLSQGFELYTRNHIKCRRSSPQLYTGDPSREIYRPTVGIHISQFRHDLHNNSLAKSLHKNKFSCFYTPASLILQLSGSFLRNRHYFITTFTRARHGSLS
jgi:hypothetical protein